MNSFPNTNIDIIGGLRNFSFADMNTIDSIDNTSVTFLASYGWFNGYSHYTDLKLEVQPKPSDNGISYKCRMEGTYPGNSAEIVALFDEMKNKRFAVLVTDNDGLVYLFTQAKFSCEFTTDTVTGKKQWSFEFNTIMRQHPAVS